MEHWEGYSPRSMSHASLFVFNPRKITLRADCPAFIKKENLRNQFTTKSPPWESDNDRGGAQTT